ncbi:hypothetical protein CUR178_08194 [Leishmania enriettii]|uniref:SRP9 domain-containing protein n=1 Tax=Leishmania enriettii TaxID=5663 RepID=A0A836GS70_LEIEN|nr:hypothetical protein CUR178_08170 [Leishmania enriettii]KAG5487182.1 hypothetical protein CUR178_08194 [Leishmania enriettii]
MRLELKDFVQATRSIHQQPGGVKRTRLMLRLRPHHSRTPFVLKATDGRTTMTTRVESQSQLRLVESLVTEFVTECTKAALGSPAPHTATAGAGEQLKVSAAAASPASTASGHNSSNPGGASATAAMKATSQARSSCSAAQGQQAHVSSSSQATNNKSGSSGGAGRGRRGKHH